MGAVGDPHSPDRRESKRRHDSRDPPPRRHGHSHEAHRHHERSRHDREHSRDRSRERSSRQYEEDRRDRPGHQHHRRENRQYNEDRRDRSGQHHHRDETRGEHSHRETDDKFDKQKGDPYQQGPGSGGREDMEGKGPRDSGRQQQQQEQQQQQQQHRQQQGRRGGAKPAGEEDVSKQRWGKPEDWAEEEAAAAAAAAAPKEAPNLGLSGKLAAETNKTVDGTGQLKYQPPPEARVCKKPAWRLYVFKGDKEAAAPITLNQTSFYLFGKDRKIADIPTDHPSCSRQHGVVCFREIEVDAPDGIATRRVVKPYLMDLESINGTTINSEKLEAARYYELLHLDVIRFGLSSREYVIMNEATV